VKWLLNPLTNAAVNQLFVNHDQLQNVQLAANYCAQEPIKKPGVQFLNVKLNWNVQKENKKKSLKANFSTTKKNVQWNSVVILSKRLPLVPLFQQQLPQLPLPQVAVANVLTKDNFINQAKKFLLKTHVSQKFAKWSKTLALAMSRLMKQSQNQLQPVKKANTWNLPVSKTNVNHFTNASHANTATKKNNSWTVQLLKNQTVTNANVNKLIVWSKVPNAVAQPLTLVCNNLVIHQKIQTVDHVIK
jgi:hypothetical protein